jgi:hypothetical protein
MTLQRSRAGAALLACLALTVTGCSSSLVASGNPHARAPQGAADATLTAFSSCGAALSALRAAAEASVTPYGLPGSGYPAPGAG